MTEYLEPIHDGGEPLQISIWTYYGEIIYKDRLSKLFGLELLDKSDHNVYVFEDQNVFIAENPEFDIVAQAPTEALLLNQMKILMENVLVFQKVYLQTHKNDII